MAFITAAVAKWTTPFQVQSIVIASLQYKDDVYHACWPPTRPAFSPQTWPPTGLWHDIQRRCLARKWMSGHAPPTWCLYGRLHMLQSSLDPGSSHRNHPTGLTWENGYHGLCTFEASMGRPWWKKEKIKMGNPFPAFQMEVPFLFCPPRRMSMEPPFCQICLAFTTFTVLDKNPTCISIPILSILIKQMEWGYQHCWHQWQNRGALTTNKYFTPNLKSGMPEPAPFWSKSRREKNVNCGIVQGL